MSDDKPVHLEGAKADLHRLLVALVKLALVTDAPSETAAWRAEALEAQTKVAAAQAGALHLDDNRWELAVKAAESDRVVMRDATVNPMLPTMSPIKLDALTAEPFDLDGAVQTIRDTASFG